MSKTTGWRRRWSQWLDRRIPAAAQVRLGHRSIFILPTGSGLLYLLLLLLMLITAINYQNSLIYGLTFWLFSVGLVAMMVTFRNLSGLTLKAGHPYPCFAGERLELPLHIQSGGRYHDALWVQFPQEAGVQAGVAAGASATLHLSFRPAQRGPLHTGRLRLDSRFPLGLFNAWTWVKLDFQGVVYPQPEYVPLVLASGDSGDNLPGAATTQAGAQDFFGLRPYQPGDSLRRIAWKQLARGKGLVSKEFDHDEGATCWLAWDSLPGVAVETRLSRLCGWVLEAHQRGWRYGLRLPGTELEPDNSEVHRDRCLHALALFGYGGQANA